MKQLFAAALFAALGLNLAHATDVPAEDQDFGCTDQATAQRYVNDFHVDLSTFGGMELCNANLDTKKLLNDLTIIERGEFGGDKRNIFIRGTIPANSYYDWAKDQTRGVRRGHDIPYATAYNSWGYFTMQDGWTKLSTLGRVGTFLHEARHTEGYTHVPCTQGPYKDASLAGCDDSLSEGGSHGLEMEYYSRVVLQGKNFHPVYEQMARLMNLGRANFVFNDNPMKKSESLVAQAAETIVTVDSSENSRRLAFQGPSDFELKRTSFGATMFKGQEAYALDLYSNKIEAIRDEYSYFKLLLDGRLMQIVQLEEVDINNRRHLVALTSAGKLYTYVYAQGRWSSPISAPDVVRLITTTPTGAEGLFAVNRQGQIQAINPLNLALGGVSGQWPTEARQFVKWKSALLKLDDAGHVLETNSGKAYMPLQYANVQQMVRAPLYDAYEMETELK